ncbi:MAG: enoyl-CoA hydratase-related protein [Bacteroidota bacterium]
MAETTSTTPTKRIELENSAVLFEQVGSVGVITLNRPDRYNGVNHDLVLGLLDALEKAKLTREIRAVVLKGNGKGFSAGADLGGDVTEMIPERMDDYITENYGAICRRIMTLSKPVIAAIHGAVAGVSTAFALACDLRIMAEKANFRYAFINIGLGTDGGAGWLLARAIGYSRAFQIAVEGEKIPASTCLELGLTNKVVPEERLEEEALAWAMRLAERPPMGVAATKRVLHHAMNHSFPESVSFEADIQAKALGSEDFQEGVMAFFEKRKPNFKGR